MEDMKAKSLKRANEDRDATEKVSETEGRLFAGRSRDDETKSERKKTAEHLQPDGSVLDQS